MDKVSIAAILIALCGCVSADPETGPGVVWTCDGGRTFSARMTESGNAVVSAGGKSYHLPGVPAASGVRYFDGRVEYWEHHEEAMLNGASGGPWENCRS